MSVQYLPQLVVEQSFKSLKIDTRPQVSDYDMLVNGTFVVTNNCGRRWFKVVIIESQKVVSIVSSKR